MKRDPLVFINHMNDACNLIEKFTTGFSKEKFTENDLVQSAVVRQIEIIGEAAKNVPAEFKEKHSQIKWSNITGMRDKLIHHYFGVDINEVWNVIINDLPKLKKQILSILKEK